MKLKSLDEHNAERQAAHDELQQMNRAHANGIACPECGAELWDSDPSITLTSYPPQKNVQCRACKYRGYRIA